MKKKKENKENTADCYECGGKGTRYLYGMGNTVYSTCHVCGYIEAEIDASYVYGPYLSYLARRYHVSPDSILRMMGVIVFGHIGIDVGESDEI